MIPVNKQAVKVALVTGAARRIGAAIVKKLHQQGFTVAIHCHQSLKDAQSLANHLNANRPDSAKVFQADLSAAHHCQQLITDVQAWAARLDLLVNNASLFLRSDCTAFDGDAWQALFTVNVQSPFVLSLAAFPLLTQNGGLIVNITDIHAEKALKQYAVYCQTKAALLMQTKALAREFAPGVRVNAVAPGAIAWPEHDNELSVKIREAIIANTPLQRHGDPVFIACAVWAFVENPFITGQVLAVDGGRSIT